MPLERNAMQTVLDGWIERCQRSNQSDKESAADCRLVFKRVGHGDETYADVSSAKRLVSHNGAADTMSLTYIENSSGLRMAPCGTPALISIDDEEKPSIMVLHETYLSLLCVSIVKNITFRREFEKPRERERVRESGETGEGGRG